jgi:hypothetical protein
MSKLKYVSDDFLTEFKANFETKYSDLYLNLDKAAISELFEKNIRELDIDFDYLPLVTPQEAVSNGDMQVQNIEIIYKSLGHISPRLATTETFLFAMMNTYYLDYLLAEIKPILHTKKVARTIQNMMYFMNGNGRSLMYQRLAKYWWIGHRTIDLDYPEDPFHLTKFMSDSDLTGKSAAFFGSKFTNNHELALGIIDGVQDVVERGLVLHKKETYNYANKYFNYVGGVRILDIMTREQIKSETIQVFEDFVSGRVQASEVDRQMLLPS